MTRCDECGHKIIREDKMGVRCDNGLQLFPKKDCHEFDRVRTLVLVEKRIGISTETVQILDASRIDNEPYDAVIQRLLNDKK